MEKVANNTKRNVCASSQGADQSSFKKINKIRNEFLRSSEISNTSFGTFIENHKPLI